jgi:hypothetical protein
VVREFAGDEDLAAFGFGDREERRARAGADADGADGAGVSGVGDADVGVAEEGFEPEGELIDGDGAVEDEAATGAEIALGLGEEFVDLESRGFVGVEAAEGLNGEGERGFGADHLAAGLVPSPPRKVPAPAVLKEQTL